MPFLVGGCARCIRLTAHKRYKQQRVAASAMNSLLHDNLAGIRQIKTYVRERRGTRAASTRVSDRLREATFGHHADLGDSTIRAMNFLHQRGAGVGAAGRWPRGRSTHRIGARRVRGRADYWSVSSTSRFGNCTASTSFSNRAAPPAAASSRSWIRPAETAAEVPRRSTPKRDEDSRHRRVT